MIDEGAFKTLVADAVRDVVREEIQRALAAQRPLSKSELAAALLKSTATVDRYVRDGMPFRREGARRIFDLDACRAWLRNRQPDVVAVEQDDVLTKDVVRKIRRAA